MSIKSAEPSCLFLTNVLAIWQFSLLSCPELNQSELRISKVIKAYFRQVWCIRIRGKGTCKMNEPHIWSSLCSVQGHRRGVKWKSLLCLLLLIRSESCQWACAKFPDSCSLIKHYHVLFPWRFSSSDLSDPIDVYSDWIDACEAANQWQKLISRTFFRVCELLVFHATFLWFTETKETEFGAEIRILCYLWVIVS